MAAGRSLVLLASPAQSNKTYMKGKQLDVSLLPLSNDLFRPKTRDECVLEMFWIRVGEQLRWIHDSN